MKTKKIAHLSTASLLVLSLTLGACGKDSTGIAAGAGTAAQQSMLAEGNANFKAWQKLITSDEKNIALAEILAATVAKENQPLIKELVTSLSQAEIENIINQVKTEREAIRKDNLFKGNIQLESSDIFKNSILKDDYSKSANLGEIQQLNFATFSYLKSKSLDAIYKAYDEAIMENSKDITTVVIQEIGKDPQMSAEIEEAAKNSASIKEFAAQLKKVEGYMDKVNVAFKASGDVNERQQLEILALGAVAAIMYKEIEKSKTFAEVLKIYKKVQIVALDIDNKVKAVRTFIKVIYDSKMEIAQGATDVAKGIVGAQKAIESAAKKVGMNERDPKLPYDPTASVIGGDAKKVTKFLHDQLFGVGTPPDPRKVPSTVIDTYKEVKTNLNSTFAAAGRMANGLENIISATNAVAATLGIKLPAKVQKVLATASKVAAGVKVASALVAGFATGGVMAAMGGISALGGLMGGSGPDPAIMEALGRIEGKLDEVLKLQQEMLDLQKKTIGMIRDLAVMIDEYHQDEMAALASLHEDSLINAEISMAIANDGLRSCESLLNKQFEISNFNPGKRTEFNGIMTYDMDLAAFYSGFKSMKDFRLFTEDQAKNLYSDCQSTYAKTFGTTNTNGNPIMSIYNVDRSGDNLIAFQRNIYRPLLDLLNKKTNGMGEKKKILHIPSATVSGLDEKSRQLLTDGPFVTEDRSDYNLTQLVSTKALQRYMSSYLLLYPVMEFDKEIWAMSLVEVVDSYYEKISGGSSTRQSSSYGLMKNALVFTQSAIAQEAILAGESLIPMLSGQNAEIVRTADSGDPSIQAVRKNPLFMRNYLTYVIKKRLDLNVYTLGRYASAVANNNKQDLAYYLGVPADSVESIGSSTLTIKVAKGNLNISLPSASDIEEGKMLYSENMYYLLKMQKNILAALVKISPSSYRTDDGRTGLANLMILK